jgi:hypothetical protein
MCTYLSANLVSDLLMCLFLVCTTVTGAAASMHGMRHEGLQMPMSSMAAASPVLGNVGMVTKEGVLGTPSAPIHMITAEGGLKVQAWRTLRTLALGFLLLSGVGALIEDRGIGKGEFSAFVDTCSISSFSWSINGGRRQRRA